MLQKIAVVLMEDVALFEFGVLSEVFGIDRTDDGVPAFDFKVCSVRPGEALSTSSHSAVIAPYGLEELEDADLVALPATTWRHEYDERILDALRRAHERGAILLTVCSGAFVLAKAGLLDGRSCATHWRYAKLFREQYPLANLDADVLFVDDGDIITSAGTAAGIDACLHLVRRELGSAVATRIARRMVVPPQRDGGQRQYVEVPVPESAGESLQPVLDWMVDNLTIEHTVPELARRARMSDRTFARRFVAETGTTPLKWVTTQRVLHARTLLEQTKLGIEQIASESGFGTAALLRHHFRRVVGVPPQDYRRTFQTAS
ncbi:helix-turn-helix domain-containing protein [Kribbella sp. NPDC006257]|uniref:GlxA family transcriptional regulator n=1 Tax=Kribbella sp. NPDC006257 TaxID=3156738 RepID=UPI0033BE3776